MTYPNGNLSRNERQRQLNVQLSVLPTFTPLNDYQVHHINRSTSPMLLHELIELARETANFSIDTEHDCYTHQAALIQIEFIQQKSILLLIETCHLPHASSVLFWLIRSLVKVIFTPSNVIYSWGNAICELTDFIPYGLFSIHTLRHITTIDIQQHFKQWYNTIFKHSCGLQPFEDDHTLCTCSYRPVKDKNNKWSLQKAIAYTFNEFFDKRRTKSNWGRHLDLTNVPHFFVLNKTQKTICEELIQYAVNDCLAVTKLMMVLKFDWSKEQLHQYNRSKAR